MTERRLASAWTSNIARQASALSGFPTKPEEADAWRAVVQALAKRRWAKAYELALPGTSEARLDPKELAYLLKLTAVGIRAEDKDALVIAGGLTPADTPWLERLFAEDMAAYLDGVAVGAASLAGSAGLAPLAGLLEREDSSAEILVTGREATGEPAVAAQHILEQQFADLATRLTTVHTADIRTLTRSLMAAASLRDVLLSEVVTLDEKTAGLKLSLGGEEVTARVSHRLLYNATSFATYLVYQGDTGGRLTVELSESTGKAPVVRDALGAAQQAVKDFTWNASTKRSRANVLLSERPLLLDFNFGGDAGYTARAEVSGSIVPTVAEIIARHQEAQAAQDSLVQNYLADAHMEQHFRPSPTDAGYDVVTDNRFYSDGTGAEWEELSFTINGSKWGPKRPPFPLLQPEKVLSLPLDLRLNTDYVYQLERARSEPRAASATRSASIRSTSRARSTGARCGSTRPATSRSRCRRSRTISHAPVVSNEEIQTFTPQGSAGGRSLSLLQPPEEPSDHAGRADATCWSSARWPSPTSGSTPPTSRPSRTPHAPPTTSCTATPTTACATS